MCKLLLITAADLTRKQVESVLAAANSDFAVTQRNGYGYLAGNADGEAEIRRFLRPASFAARTCNSELPVWFTGETTKDGTLPAKCSYVLCHGRTSTNRVSIQNVHPFRNGDTYFAHNGILVWKGPGPEPLSADGCDSESYFAWLQNGGSVVSSNTAWAGYGACVRINTKTAQVELWKDETAQLYGAPIRSGGWIFATCKETIHRCAKAAHVKLGCAPLSIGALSLTWDKAGTVTQGQFAGFGSRAWDSLASYSVGESHAPAKLAPAKTTPEPFPSWEPRRHPSLKHWDSAYLATADVE